jgi:prepilin signal peptidase PulO-like enzyme (type II secretory pathway)
MKEKATLDESSLIGAAAALLPSFLFGAAVASAAERGRIELQLLRLLVGTASAVLGAACFLRYGVSPRAFIGAFLAAVLVVVAVVDIRVRIVPNAIVLPAACVILVAQIVFYPDRTIEWVLATVLAPLPLFIMSIISPRGMGMGDVKLALVLGAALGRLVIVGLLVGTFAGALVAVGLFVREGRAARGKTIPYAPYLALGGLVAFFIG